MEGHHHEGDRRPQRGGFRGGKQGGARASRNDRAAASGPVSRPRYAEPYGYPQEPYGGYPPEPYGAFSYGFPTRYAEPSGYGGFDAYGAPPPAAEAAMSKKVIIRHLDGSLTSDDIRELFSSVGAVKSVTLMYNKEGRATSAEVQYHSAAAAEGAVAEFHNRQVDRMTLSVHMEGEGRPRAAPGGPSGDASRPPRAARPSDLQWVRGQTPSSSAASGAGAIGNVGPLFGGASGAAKEIVVVKKAHVAEGGEDRAHGNRGQREPKPQQQREPKPQQQRQSRPQQPKKQERPQQPKRQERAPLTAEDLDAAMDRYRAAAATSSAAVEGAEQQ